jgi:hypothetical protein
MEPRPETLEVGLNQRDEDVAATPPETNSPSQILPAYLVIANISKKDNIKRLISLAVAYGIENVLIGELLSA